MDPKFEEIKAELARISELSVSELDALKVKVGDYFDEVDALDVTPENVAILQELGKGISAIMNREGELKAAEEQAIADKEEARKIRASLNGGDDDGADGGDEGTEGGDDGGEGAEDGTKTPELVAAGKFRSSPSKMNGRNGKALERIKPVSNPISLVAAGGGHGMNAGQKFDDKWKLAQYMSDVLRGLSKTQANGRVIIASADWRDRYDESRRLTDNSFLNAQKIDAACSIEALVASGGTSLPANVDYNLDVWAGQDRPVKQGLAQFLCDRGALTYRNPPTLASVSSSTAVWTEATDANPNGATKPVYVVPVPSAETVYVNAIPTRLQFGNFMGNFDPETIAANTELSLATAARVADTELVSLIAAAAVSQGVYDITSAAALGASRDFFTTIELMAANFRYTHRLPDSVVLNILLPGYVKNMLRADRLIEQAHDSAGQDVFMVSDSWIEDALALRGIEPIWQLDALPVNGSVYPTQQFSGFTNSSALPGYPAKIVWHIFIKGSIQFLDSGLLSLGIVRDATLDSTNDYETFTETFEGIAFRGFLGGLLQIVQTLVINGASGRVA